MRLYEYYNDDKKEITVMIPDKLSKEDVDDLEDYFKIIISQAKRRLKK